MVLDPNSQIGMIRLRIADWSDLPILDDSVIQSALDQNDGSVTRASKLCAQYILGFLTSKVHRRLGLQLEIYGAEWYKNYKDFILLTIKDPTFMDISPLPYSAASDCPSPILLFQESWNRNFTKGTEGQQLNMNALYSPNEGGEYGNFPIYSSEGY